MSLRERERTNLYHSNVHFVVLITHTVNFMSPALSITKEQFSLKK